MAGSLGPTNRTASLSPDVNNPAFRAVTFDQLVAAFLIDAQSMASIEVFNDAAIIERKIIAIILFFGDNPAFLGSHFLGKLQDKRLAVDEHSVEVEYDRS